ncbi:MAG: type IV pilus biogenesis/stability protein PilW [Steroidobacteraceae bacterium]
MNPKFLILCGLLSVIAACVSNDPKLGNKDNVSAAAYNLQLGLDYFRQGNLSLAKEKLDRSLKQNPDSAQAHAAAGMLYERLNESRKADQYYSRAVALEPKNGDVVNTYAVFLCRRGDLSKGEQLALQAANNQLYKTPEAAWLNAGICALDAGKTEVAEAHFRRALTANPKFSSVLMQLAILKFKTNDPLLARGFLERFHIATQATAESLWLGVRVEQAMANPAGAADYASQLKERFPRSPQARALSESEHKN